MFDLPKEMEDKKLIRESVLPKNSKRIRSIFILNIALPFNTYKVRLPLVPVVSILSYSVEYEIGILSLLLLE